MDQVLKVSELYFESPDVVKNKIYTNIYYAILEADPDAFDPKNLKDVKDSDSKETKEEVKEVAKVKEVKAKEEAK